MPSALWRAVEGAGSNVGADGANSDVGADEKPVTKIVSCLDADIQLPPLAGSLYTSLSERNFGSLVPGVKSGDGEGSWAFIQIFDADREILVHPCVLIRIHHVGELEIADSVLALQIALGRHEPTIGSLVGSRHSCRAPYYGPLRVLVATSELMVRIVTSELTKNRLLM